MVYKCCVPQCTSPSGIPSHVLPKNSINAEIWLRAIGRNDMIGKFLTIFLDYVPNVFSKENFIRYSTVYTLHVLYILSNIFLGKDVLECSPR